MAESLALPPRGAGLGALGLRPCAVGAVVGAAVTQRQWREELDFLAAVQVLRKYYWRAGVVCHDAIFTA